MIYLEDVLELNQTIKALEKRQIKAKLLAAALLEEIDEIDCMLDVLKDDYKKLKEKTND